MTVGHISLCDAFGKNWQENDEATADRDICPLQMLRSLSEAMSAQKVTLFWPATTTIAVVSNILRFKLTEKINSMIRYDGWMDIY